MPGAIRPFININAVRSSLIRSWANYFKFNAVEISKSSFEITESRLNFELLMRSPKGPKIAVVL